MKSVRIGIALLLIALFIPFQLVTQAAVIGLPATIELIGDAKELSFTETNEPGFVYEDVFLPGNAVSRTLTIRNLKDVPFRLSFELERRSAQAEIDLLNQIDIQVYEGEKLLCSGPIDANVCDDRQFYAVLNPGDVRTLTMIATFNAQAGNEYKNKVAEYDWIFDAVVTTVPTTGKPTAPKPPVITTTGSPLVNTGVFTLEMVALGSVLFAGGRYLLKRNKTEK